MNGVRARAICLVASISRLPGWPLVPWICRDDETMNSWIVALYVPAVCTSSSLILAGANVLFICHPAEMHGKPTFYYGVLYYTRRLTQAASRRRGSWTPTTLTPTDSPPPPHGLAAPPAPLHAVTYLVFQNMTNATSRLLILKVCSFCTI